MDKTTVVERFLRYVKVDTQSDEESESCPSTAKQLDLAEILARELKELGLEDAQVDENGYLFATFKGNVEGSPVIGLLAHMDTAPAFSGTNVKPILHENYDGGVIELEDSVVIDPKDTPELKQCIKDTIITSDGTTLLGSDDKAGIAEIMAALELFKAHPELPRPTLRIGFTPDEEIGRGADKFDIEKFGAKAAFTIDGDFIGEVNSETFSADKGTVVFEGVSVHPGTAKGKMVNAMDWAGVFLTRLPQEETPQQTEGREGFFHPTDMTGDAAKVTVNLILRDFDDRKLAERGKRLEQIIDRIRSEEPRLKVELKITEQYRNMARWLTKQPEILEKAMEAIRKAGIEPNHRPIRGGTDGSQLTQRGLPTPNLFTGGVNFHGPKEWISTRAMGKAVCVIVNLVQLWGARI
ncbi:MAG: peptidase T [Deltaproteobacteria bacterium]|nr:peptidase T [Deltaproteobacteria bacterium]